jgi:hypothetical protein
MEQKRFLFSCPAHSVRSADRHPSESAHSGTLFKFAPECHPYTEFPALSAKSGRAS